MSARAKSSQPAALVILLTMFRYRQGLTATTIVELRKRYAGSVFGILWVLLYPVLLLAVYIFVYMVVFKVRFPGFSEFEYVLYVFCGLVPYLAMWDAISTGAVSIKQNIHLVRNVMLPIELIPIRSVAMSMVAQFVSLAILIVLTAAGGKLTPHILWLPLIIVFQTLFLLGIVFFVASLAVTLLDISYFLNLFLLLLLFLSPIGFKPEMIPAGLEFIVTYNPVYYITEMFRSSLLFGTLPDPITAFIFLALCSSVFVAGCAFFIRFKYMLIDYE